MAEMEEVQEQGGTVRGASDAIEMMLGATKDPALAGLVNEEEEPVAEAVEEEEVEEEVEEPEVETEEVEEAEVETEELEEDAPPITSLTDLAAAVGLPLEDVLGALNHSIDGSDVPLKDIVSNYRNQKQVEAATNQYNSFALDNQVRLEEYTKSATVLAKQFDLLDHQFESALNSGDMVALRASDPAEWSARVYELNDKIKNLRSARMESAEEYDRYMTGEREKFLQHEGQKLVMEVPDWGEAKFMKSVETLRSIGYSDEELGKVGDSRLIKAGLELGGLRDENARLKALAVKSQEAVKKIKKSVPKTVEPGAKKPAQTAKGINKNKVVSLKQRLAKSGNLTDAGKAIEAMMR